MSSSTISQPQFLTKLAENLDKHLLLPVLAFAADNTADAATAQQYRDARAAVMAKTGLFDEASESDPATAERKAAIVKKHSQLSNACSSATKIFFNAGAEEEAEAQDGSKLSLSVNASDMEEMRRTGRLSMASLISEHKTTGKAIRGLYELGFQLYDVGCYDQAADVLHVYRSITDKKDTDERDVSALWGKTACDLSMGYWDAAEVDLDDLRAELDPLTTPTVQRVWLLHWSLFYYFKRADSAAMLEHIFNIERSDREKTFMYTNVIQSAAPYLLRYVAAAAVLNKKKKSQVRRTQRIVEQESYAYGDAITMFVDELCNKSNFAKAAALLPECEALLKEDFFLADHADDFINKARMMIFEDKLRIHRTVSIPQSAEQLGMSVAQAEVWLVNLIREAKLDAKVNSLAGTVSVNVAAHHKTVWQEVLETAERTAVQNAKH